MKKIMNLNKETAIRLWVQQFGKKQKAIDFSGREIAKAAYNDRNSKYGWNVDHILPLSRGGKTADYNLVCCHILTNDEKADKFPCFKANTREFEIQKRQNHYEIIARAADHEAESEEVINFLDMAQGLNCWRHCKPDKGEIFVGYVKIRVEISNESDRLLERYRKFLRELFGVGIVFVEAERNVYINGWSYINDRSRNRSYIFTVIAGELPTKEDTENLLDDCIILNSYSVYFLNRTGFERIQIVCGMECYDNHFEMSLKCKENIIKKQVQFSDSLMIDELVRKNTSAKEKLKDISYQSFYPYNMVFVQLDKNLKKYIEA
ncbi:MAG: HNH endonuclease [Alistipes sp.]|nr:HNH endonuclease [Alistipes sp.]